jgi:hypothetical protein
MLLVGLGFVIAYHDSHDPMVLASGCFVWAAVYALLTGPRRYL